MWLNEGFGEFMPGQYWRERLGRLAEEDYYLTDYQEYVAADRDRRMPLAALGSNVIYPKGALVLVMLKKYLGEQRFWAAAHRFLVDHALGTAVTDDFRQAILSATGENLAWFFDQWLYQAGHPDFEVRATYDSAAAAVRLIVRQTQADTTPADSTGLRYTTPRVFRMPVLVRVGTERGDRTARAWLESGEDTVIVPGVDTPPTMVVFDDGNTILKRLSFPQPTAWLTVQLERDPDLWNRSWVLGQLAGRRNDGSALGALAQAAIAADYPLIRAQALEALAGFRADSLARSVAAWALADTAAAVRAAAFDLLAEAAGDPELARRAFEQDSSDEVRAAALAAMVELDSSSAPAVLRRALFTPSYRGVIGNTALALLARHGDTTQVGLIDSVLPRLPQAAFALVRLVNQGSTPALEALAAHLADPQPAIRRSVLRAFEVVVPRDLAVVRLRGALQGLTSEDARREITQVLERWEKR
jgi:aminopeptidase N